MHRGPFQPQKFCDTVKTSSICLFLKHFSVALISHPGSLKKVPDLDNWSTVRVLYGRRKCWKKITFFWQQWAFTLAQLSSHL